VLENRLLVVQDTGQIRVVGSVGGWRADTLEVESRTLSVDPEARLLFEETWSGGLAGGTWQMFGDPEPVANPGGGPDGTGVLHNRGDENYASGALTELRFPAADGLSVEVWGRAPFTRGLFQTWGLDLADDPRLDPVTGERPPGGRTARVRMMSSTEDPAGVATVIGPASEVSVPVPDDVGEWRLHVLQLHPDGTIEWIVDGRRHASLRSDVPVPDSVHVAIGGRMVGTTIEHGSVRVWRGLRYVTE